MCDTDRHRMEDPVLADGRPSLELMRTHPYGDECCRVTKPVDGPSQWKPGWRASKALDDAQAAARAARLDELEAQYAERAAKMALSWTPKK